MKKIIALIVVGILCVTSFAACGKKGETATQANVSEAAGATEAQAAEAQTQATVSGSGIYADLDNLVFYINGKEYRLGETTLQDMIDDGVPFKEDVQSIAKTPVQYFYDGGLNLDIGDDYGLAKIQIQNTDYNDTRKEKLAADCVLSAIYFAPFKNEAQNALSFNFPLSLTAEELKANSGEPTEETTYETSGQTIIEYQTASSKYPQSPLTTGYSFTFKDGTLLIVSIDWRP